MTLPMYSSFRHSHKPRPLMKRNSFHQLLPSDPLIPQMEVTFSPLKRSLKMGPAMGRPTWQKNILGSTCFGVNFSGAMSAQGLPAHILALFTPRTVLWVRARGCGVWGFWGVKWLAMTEFYTLLGTNISPTFWHFGR